MKLEIDFKQLDEMNAFFLSFDRDAQRAKTSALKSTGNMVRAMLKGYLRTGGHGNMAKLDRLSRKAIRPKGGKWQVLPRMKPDKPLYNLAKFSRYRVDEKQGLLHIDLGKSRKGRPGVIDPVLSSFLSKHQEGEKYSVTDKMRRFFGASRPSRSSKKKLKPWVDFFPISKRTHAIELPARPVIDPVFELANPKIFPHFQDKFFKALERYAQQ